MEPVISESTFTEAVGNAEVWHPVHGPLQIFRVMIRDFLAKHRRVIEQHSVEGQTVLVAHPLDLVSRIFREADPSMLLVGVHLQPVILRTYRDPPRLSPWWFEPRKPSWLLRGGYALLDHLVIDAILRREILSVRSDLGVQAPLRRIMDRWWLSPDATMALYPSRFSPATVGFCNQLVHCGFPLEDVSGSDFEVPSGSPVVFTLRDGQSSLSTIFRGCGACMQETQARRDLAEFLRRKLSRESTFVNSVSFLPVAE